MAQWLIEELRDEERWAKRFAESQGALSKLAAEARADMAQGRAEDLAPEDM